MSPNPLTLTDTIDLFLSQHIRTTKESYGYVLRILSGYVGAARPIKQVQAQQLLEFMQYVRERPTVNSPSTVNKYIKTLRTFMNWCIKAGFIEPPSPALALRYEKKKSGNATHQRAMSESHYLQLRTFAQFDARASALVTFLGDTGCRIGGAVGLKWTDINFDTRSATVTEKGDRTRPVFFGDECAAALLSWRGIHSMRDGDYAFSKYGGRIKANSLGQYFERLCKKAGIGQHGPHSLRHRKGHQMADAGVAPTIAAQLLGHESVKTTLDSYYPHDYGRVQEVAEQLAAKPAPNEKIISFEQKIQNS